MFGINKIKEAQKKAEEFKSNLASLSFEGESLNGMVKAVCNGNKEFSSIRINESIFKIREQSEVEQMVLEAVNEAISKADYEARQQMSSIMPNIPGLNL